MAMPDTLEALRAGRLHGVQRLDLTQLGLRELPREVFALADTLEILDLGGNVLEDLPADLPRLHRLRILFCTGNRFERMPEVLGRCPALEMVAFKSNRLREVPASAIPPRLRWLILTDNQIEALPDTLGDCPRLEKLALAGNQLSTLPASLARCEQLALLRIAAKLTQGFIQSYTAKFGIGLPEWRTLGMLGRFGPLPSIRIAELAEMDRASISRAVAWLEKRGMVRRLDDPAHQRRKTVAMTEAGRALHARIGAHARQRQQQILAALSPAEREGLNALLGKLDEWASELHSGGAPGKGVVDGRIGRAFGWGSTWPSRSTTSPWNDANT